MPHINHPVALWYVWFNRFNLVDSTLSVMLQMMIPEILAHVAAFAAMGPSINHVDQFLAYLTLPPSFEELFLLNKPYVVNGY